MTAPGQGASAPHFADASFDEMYFGQPRAKSSSSSADLQAIDFGASQAYFGGFESTASGSTSRQGGDSPPRVDYDYSYGQNAEAVSPSPAISGLDPISKLGFTSNRASSQQYWGTNGFADMHSPSHYNTYNSAYPPTAPFPHPSSSAYAHFSPSNHDPQFHQQFHQSAYTAQQHKDEAAHRLAEIERRNRVREEEKARRTLEIQKQVDDGMAALQLERDHAAHRTAEVERRNKQREEEKEKRRLAIQKQVEDGIKAIQREKERERARVEADRSACRKWLSDLNPTSTAADASHGSIDLYSAIGRQMRGFWQDSRPSASSQAHRNEVIADVQRAVNAKWPGQGLQVSAFGSSVTGLITESSDLDLVLLDPTRPYGVGTPPELRRDTEGFVRHNGGMPDWYSTNQIANLIRNSGKFRNVVPISSAAVPIVKMVHKKYDIPADININERFGLFNSQLIQAYANLQPQIVRPLIFFLKHWYSRSDLNDPAGKRGSMTFSSYTIALMALQVLQVEGVLPNLQSPVLISSLNIRPQFLYSRIRRPRRGKNGRPPAVEEVTPPQKYDVTFATSHADTELQKGKASRLSADDTSTNAVSSTDRLLGKMLVAFIRFYTQLDRRTQVVSVVNGSPLQRKRGSHPKHVLFDSASENEEETGTEASLDPLQLASRDGDARAALREEQQDVWAGEELVVQDPFIVDRNTSRNIKAAAIEKWRTTMQSAADFLHIQAVGDADHAPRMRLEDVPLILDLCIPHSVRFDANVASRNDKVGAAGEEMEPWRHEEEEAAQAREIAKQAAKNLHKEKKKQARRSKASEARRLQEEAAMVEDMIDGIDPDRPTTFTSARLSDNWRLRTDSSGSGHGNGKGSSNSTSFGNGKGNGADLSSVPFTFSVSRSPAPVEVPVPKKPAPVNGDAAKQLATADVDRSPAVSTNTDGSSESEDIDLVALRLEQTARLAEP